MTELELKPTIAKLSTGIAGLDDIIYGGIPENSQIIIIGDVGSGKTLISFEIAYRNAVRGIPTTYLTVEENKGTLVSFIASTFSGLVDMKALIESGKIHVEEKKLQYAIKGPENIQAIVADIIKTAEENHSKLLIIDSLSLMRALYPDDRAFTRGINYIAESIRNQNITCIITFEVTERTTSDRAPGLFEESMFDGIIRLTRRAADTGVQYQLTVIKMRYSQFKSAPVLFSITPSGITISPA